MVHISLWILSLLLLSTPVFSACDDFAEDIAGWTYTQNYPQWGNTSLSLTPSGTLKVDTKNGFGLWIHYTPFTPFYITNARKFSFSIRGKNTNKQGWQYAVPSVTFVDAAGGNITYEPYQNTLSVDGITWNKYELTLDWQFRPAGSTFNPKNLIAKVIIYTDTWDVGYSVELDNITFIGDSNKCNYFTKGCRLLGTNINTWSYVQELPNHGSSFINIASNIITISTTTGFPLFTTFTHPTTTGGDRFSFTARAINTNIPSWQYNLPHVIFTDDLKNTATFLANVQQLPTDGVTWKKFNLFLNSSSNPGFDTFFSPQFNRFSVKNVTLVFDTWTDSFTVDLQNIYFDTKYVPCK